MINLLSHLQEIAKAKFDRQNLIKVANLCKPADLHVILQTFATYHISTEGLDFTKLTSHETDIKECIMACFNLEISKKDFITLIRYSPKIQLSCLLKVCDKMSIELDVIDFYYLNFSEEAIIHALKNLSSISEAKVAKPLIVSMDFIPFKPITDMPVAYKAILEDELNDLYRRMMTAPLLYHILTNDIKLGNIKPYDIESDNIYFCILSLLHNSIGSNLTIIEKLPSLLAHKTYNPSPLHLMKIVFDTTGLNRFDMISSILRLPSENHQIKALSSVSFSLQRISAAQMSYFIDIATRKVKIHILALLFNNNVFAKIFEEIPPEKDNLFSSILKPNREEASELASLLVNIITNKPNPNMFIYALSTSIMTSSANDDIGYKNIESEDVADAFLQQAMVKHLPQDILTSFILAVVKSHTSILRVLSITGILSRTDLSPANTLLISQCKLLYPNVGECCVCYDEKELIILKQCMHALCGDCAGVIIATDTPACPLCRMSIEKTSVTLPIFIPSFL